jgi:hypothetical protein
MSLYLLPKSFNGILKIIIVNRLGLIDERVKTPKDDVCVETFERSLWKA